MSYLLDTNVVSEAKRKRPNQNVLRWLAAQPFADTYVSVLTLGELEEGIVALGEVSQAEALREWLTQLKESFGGRILDIDQDTVTTWGRIRAEAKRRGRTPPAIDALIAATAITFDFTLVTRNVADMDALPVKLFNPFEAS